MPATPFYIHNLDAGIAALAAVQSEWVDRRTVEEALGVSKWTAWRILKRCGAEEGPGRCLVCRREDLVLRLREFLESGTFATEVERRRRVERYLDGMARYLGQKRTEIARNDAASSLLGSRFSKLPAGIDLRPGELRIEFDGTADFLQKFGAVVFALQNDYDQISELLDRGHS